MSHKAILVKYLAFTNHKPARVKALVHKSEKVRELLGQFA